MSSEFELFVEGQVVLTSHDDDSDLSTEESTEKERNREISAFSKLQKKKKRGKKAKLTDRPSRRRSTSSDQHLEPQLREQA